MDDLLSPPSHGVHGGETTVLCMNGVPLRRAIVYRPHGDKLGGILCRGVGPSKCRKGVSCHLADAVESVHGRHLRLKCAILIPHKQGRVLLGQREVHTFTSGARGTKSNSWSGTAPTCELCHTTQSYTPSTLRGSLRRPSTTHFKAFFLTKSQVGPLMPWYTAS